MTLIKKRASKVISPSCARIRQLRHSDACARASDIYDKLWAEPSLGWTTRGRTGHNNTLSLWKARRFGVETLRTRHISHAMGHHTAISELFSDRYS